jgi:hypothetical protein
MDYADILFCAVGGKLTIRPWVFNEQDLQLTVQDVFNAARNVTRRGRCWTCAWPCLVFCILVACQPNGAPGNTGVCWRAVGGASTKLRYVVVANDVASLDDCAALLETYHLQGARISNGAYQGYFIFVDDREVASSTETDGFRYPIFQPSQRGEIDGDLRRLIRERAGKPLTPRDVAVERQ